MKLQKTLKYVGEIELCSGLAIKGSSTDLNIGGVDAEVIKNPITKFPYIPGSSLKGKIRSLLEQKYGKFKEVFDRRTNEVKDLQPCGCGKNSCFVCKIFGAHMNPKSESAPTRIIVRDCNLTEESLAIAKEAIEQGRNYLEEKAENIINRKSGVAGSPRVMERVPAGMKFNVEIILAVFEGDNEKEMKEKVEEGLTLLENSALGGSGSRGYGAVKFTGKWE